MRTRGLVFAMSCLFALTVGLTSCGGNDGPTIVRDAPNEGDTKSMPSLFGEGDGAIEPIGPFVMADDHLVTITLVSKQVDAWGDVGFNFEVLNKGDRAIHVKGKEESFVIDGIVIQPTGNVTVQPGETGMLYLWFNHYEFGSDALNDLNDARGSLSVLDDETFDEIGVYSFSL